MFSGENIQIKRLGKNLFPPFTFYLKQGECLIFQGPNGQGKTSLLRVLAGLLESYRGVFFWNGLPITPTDATHRCHVAYLHCDVIKDTKKTVQEILSHRLWLYNRPSSITMIADTLEAFHIKHLANIPTAFLSQGQRQRVALCLICLSQRPLWLLDEPYTHLDTEGKTCVNNAIQHHLTEGGGVVVTSPDTIHIPHSHQVHLSNQKKHPFFTLTLSHTKGYDKNG